MSAGLKYSEGYIQEVFTIWYSANCPTHLRLWEILNEKGFKDETDRIPSSEQLRIWKTEYRWIEQAESIRAEATKKMEIVLADETVEMWKEHAKAAREVAISALAYIRENGFDSSSSAVQAIKWAQEEERKTRGAEAFITAIKDKSSEDLMETIRELMERSSATDDVIDTEPKD